MSDWWLSELLFWATLAVIVGVALDIFGFVAEAKEKGWKNLPWYNKAEIVGFALLVLGLFGELVFSTIIHTRDVATLERVKGKNGELEKALDRQAKKISEADNRLDDISDLADDADDTAQDASDSADTANNSLKGLQVAEIKLRHKIETDENAISARDLTEAQARSLVKSLKGKIPTIGVIATRDEESAGYAENLAIGLSELGLPFGIISVDKETIYSGSSESMLMAYIPDHKLGFLLSKSFIAAGINFFWDDKLRGSLPSWMPPNSIYVPLKPPVSLSGRMPVWVIESLKNLKKKEKEKKIRGEHVNKGQ